jgi:O-antigen/teichoic acid export membrane protein
MTLMSGTMLSQVISILLSPILTRLYTPDQYGLLGLFAAIVSTISVVATGKFETAILLPKTDDKAYSLAKLSFRILSIITAINLVILVLFKDQLLTIFNATALDSYVYLTLISIFSIGGFNIYSNLLNRFKRYKGLAASKVVKTSGSTLSQLGFGVLNFGFIGLLLGRIIGDFSGLVLTSYFTKKTPRYKTAKSVEIKEPISKIAKEYEEFPKITAPQSFINTASASFPVLILSTFFTSSIVGLYTQCIKVTYLPITIISASTYQVFSQKITALYNESKTIYGITISTIKKLSLIGAIPFIILMLFAPFLFAFVFGDEWRESGRYAQVLAPYLFLNYLTNPLAYIPILLKQQKKVFTIHIIYLILRIAALLVGVYFKSAFISVSSFSLVGFLTLSYVFFWYLKLAKSTISSN